MKLAGEFFHGTPPLSPIPVLRGIAAEASKTAHVRNFLDALIGWLGRHGPISHLLYINRHTCVNIYGYFCLPTADEQRHGIDRTTAGKVQHHVMSHTRAPLLILDQAALVQEYQLAKQLLRVWLSLMHVAYSARHLFHSRLVGAAQSTHCLHLRLLCHLRFLPILHVPSLIQF